MVKFGNFIYHYRNFLFPVFYLFLFVPSRHLFPDYRMALVLGFSVAAIGQICRVATIGLKYIIRGGKNRRVYAEDLVTTGIFAHSRNPLYVGNVLILIGLGIMSNTLLFNLVLSPLFIFFYQCIIRAEENFLRNKFGEAFNQYCADVNRWIPRLTGLGETLNSMRFNWNRVIIREYTSAYVWLSGSVLVILNTLYKLPGQELFDRYNIPLFMTLGVLLVFYLFTRYLKKSKKLKAD
jgi:protein-S-isoprenylcysteine O-methyltransferase Ste14